MTTGATAPPRVPTPRLTKAPPTSGLSPDSVAARNTTSTATTTPIEPPSATTPASRAGTPAQLGGRRGPRGPPVDPLSDRATAALIRRVLCPEQQLDKGRDTSTPIDELLPPLTSRNDVDLQLYALIAIILREYVQKWYNKITPDETFVAETVQIIAHCTRALEQRLRKVDLESLLFDEIPDLVDKHVNSVCRRSACQLALTDIPHHQLIEQPTARLCSRRSKRIPARSTIPCGPYLRCPRSRSQTRHPPLLSKLRTRQHTGSFLFTVSWPSFFQPRTSRMTVSRPWLARYSRSLSLATWWPIELRSHG